MKKFKYYFVILVVSLCCLMTACNKVYYWEVAQSVENISKIEILEEFDLDGVHHQVFICEIAPEYYEEVVNDVQAMPAHRYFGPPGRIRGKLIKITFADGTYDEIAQREPSHFTEPDGSHALLTWLGFNDNGLFQLVEKWLAKS